MSNGEPVYQGSKSRTNIIAPTLVCSSNPTFGMRICRVMVILAGATAGSINDAASVAAAAIANEIFAIPNVVGSYLVDAPCSNGIVVIPGTGQVVALTYD